MTLRIYVPGDAAALSVGAEEVDAAITREIAARKLDAVVIRNGSRGLLWLEPLVEVETPAGRVAYGPVGAGDVPDLFASGFLDGKTHPLHLGLTEEIPFLKNQERLTFARCGVIDPLSLDDYIAHDGYRGLKRALTLAPAVIVDEVTTSGLRGRGGAGFPTGIKWKTVLGAVDDQKYIVCNADEGDSGTFADRMLLEGDPFILIEGMTIAGIAVGATQGYVYVRSEYPHAFRTFGRALKIARERGYLGADVAGSGKRFDIEVRMGAGAYICGEETSLLESLEGKRGVIRFKPPLPALKGLFGRPTVVNNVLSLAAVPTILDKGAAFYKDSAWAARAARWRSSWPATSSVAAWSRKPSASRSARRSMILAAAPIPAAPCARCKPVGRWAPIFLNRCSTRRSTTMPSPRPRACSAMAAIVVFDDTVDLAHQARFAMEFCAEESCGKCTPCRIARRAVWRRSTRSSPTPIATTISTYSTIFAI